MSDNSEMLWVCVYRDTIGLYSEDEMRVDNLIELQFPREIVQDWYQQNEQDNKKETANELGIPLEECTFDRWFNEVYTADDTDGLFAFAASKGFTAVRPF